MIHFYLILNFNYGIFIETFQLKNKVIIKFNDNNNLSIIFFKCFHDIEPGIDLDMIFWYFSDIELSTIFELSLKQIM